jgi:phosphatidylserine/phosphatidylglycerophosphate/cardiolipin synthase-like enzyme
MSHSKTSRPSTTGRASRRSRPWPSVSPSPPPVFDHLLAAAGRGVQVRLLFRADNLAGGLVRTLQSGGVDFRTLTDLHAKFLITDTTGMNGSANFTQASADRASEVATFFSDPSSCTICAQRSTTTGSGLGPIDGAPINPWRDRPAPHATSVRLNGYPIPR